MKKMNNKLLDYLFDYESWWVESSVINFSKVMFKVDFGPWKQGHIAYSMKFDLDRQTLTEYHEYTDSTVGVEVKLLLVLTK